MFLKPGYFVGILAAIRNNWYSGVYVCEIVVAKKVSNV